MFTCGLKESTERRVVLKETSSSVFKNVLGYIYSGKMTLSGVPEALVPEYLGLAHQYQLDDLEAEISTTLESSLRVCNVVERFSVAFLYSLGDLKNTCLAFMDDNASAVLRKDAYLQLSEVVAEIISVIFLLLWVLIKGLTFSGASDRVP